MVSPETSVMELHSSVLTRKQILKYWKRKQLCQPNLGNVGWKLVSEYNYMRPLKWNQKHEAFEMKPKAKPREFMPKADNITLFPRNVGSRCSWHQNQCVRRSDSMATNCEFYNSMIEFWVLKCDFQIRGGNQHTDYDRSHNSPIHYHNQNLLTNQETDKSL